MPTKIEWAEESWNPVTGCTPISDGCKNCYARRIATTRFRGRFGYPADDPFRVTVHPDRLEQPLRWKKPRRIFTVSMGDLFHKDVPDEFIREVFLTILHPNSVNHTYLILTKRPERMRDYLAHEYGHVKVPFLWLGVTAENQKQADKRIPILLQIPAAVRFVSVEPMLGAVRLDALPASGGEYLNALTGAPDGFSTITGPHLDWVIAGAETGPEKRHMELDWPRSLRYWCQDAGIPYFYKRGSDGSRLLDGREHNEYPEVQDAHTNETP